MRANAAPTVDVIVELSPAPAGARAAGGGDRTLVQQCMTDNVGVLRSRESLERALAVLSHTSSVGDRELTNVATLARAVTTAALARTESRGAHSRVALFSVPTGIWTALRFQFPKIAHYAALPASQLRNRSVRRANFFT